VFFILPVGVEEATVDRIPWVSIGFAAVCAIAFAVTWVVPRNPDGMDEDALLEIVGYWRDHPYLEPSADFQERFLNPRAVSMLHELRAEAETAGQVPDASTRETEQSHLDQLVSLVMATAEHSLLRKLSLVPARGFLQPGWLTHMFLHFGWMHILGNLFFFYLVGPLLEDIWGRPLFAGFYIVGGLVAGFAHFALDVSSQSMMAGASGAIAACIGAFTLRYAARKIRMGYFVTLYIRVWRGTFLMPAWLWGLLWFGAELWSFLTDDGTSGVAVMAHLGGFGFGFGTAYALRQTGIEARFIAPEIEKKVAWTQHPGLAEATEAVARTDPAAAQAAYKRVLADQPDNWEAQLGMAKLQLEAGQVEPGMQRLERTFELLLSKNLKDAVWHIAEELGSLVEPTRMRPSLAYRVASTIEEAPDGLHYLAEPFYVAVGGARGQLAAKALLRAAKIRLDLRDRPELAMGYLASAKSLPSTPPELLQRIQEMEARAEALPSFGASNASSWPSASRPLPAPEADEPLAPATPQAVRAEPRIISCRVMGLSGNVLSLESKGGKKATVELAKILAIAVGSMPAPPVQPGGPTRRLMLTDLVMSWGADGTGPTVLRMTSNAMGLQTLYPGKPPREAFATFLSHLLKTSGATALPDANALATGSYPSYPSEDAFNAAFYGSDAA
jgi:membrane associated rhomboid family serine protease